MWAIEEIPADLAAPEATQDDVINKLAALVTAKTKDTREKLKEEYGLTQAQMARDEAATKGKLASQVTRALAERDIADKHLADEQEAAATEAEALAVQAKREEADAEFKDSILSIVSSITESVAPRSSPARRRRRSRSGPTSRWTTHAPICAASPALSRCF